MPKELLFSVTKDEFKFDTFKAGGKGGQKQNKTNSGVRCTHKETGAVGEARDARGQLENKHNAFLRCIATDAFQRWLDRKAREMSYTKDERRRMEQRIKERVARDMAPSNLRIEAMVEGKWVEIDPNILENDESESKNLRSM